MIKKINVVTIRMTGNDLFYYWLQGIKAKLEGVLKESNSKKTQNDLKEIIKLMK